jgi:hypothetical protein
MWNERHISRDTPEANLTFKIKDLEPSSNNRIRRKYLKKY